MSNREGIRHPGQWRQVSHPSALSNYSQEQIKKTQSDSTVTLCTFDICSWASPGKVGKKSGLWVWNCSHTPAVLFFLFFSWCFLPPANLAPQWEHSHQFCGSQLSCSSTALREPHRTPGTGWARADSPQLFPSSPAEFWATASLSKAYCYDKKMCGASKMPWTVKQDENTHLP